jgi:alkylation response protein AidB-like acyl-CoA dehydrogenase
MAVTQVLPSPVAGEAVAGLVEIVQDAVTDQTGDQRWRPDHLWSELAKGGWTALADADSPGAEGDLAWYDLTVVAEAWGRSLVGLPLIPTLVARRWLKERPAVDVAIGIAVAEFESTLLPYADAVSCVFDLHGVVERPELGDLDRWCPTMPMATAAHAQPLPVPVALDLAALTLAEAVGVADRALTEAVEYAKIRKQFDRPIGSFQAVKHRLADMHCNVELARSGVTWFCSAPEQMAGTVGTVLQMCSNVVEGAVQIHGGIGYTWECDLHFAMRHVAQAHRVVTALVAGAGLPDAPQIVVG